jgi:hypothetical protein
MTRSVLLLDFDNVFSTLASLDFAAAIRFAEQPDEWLERLRTDLVAEGERRWLVLRCYMNPSGSILGPDKERKYFNKFRPFFVRAGFEVVDCPSLTYGAKNGADIKMVIDALDLLAAVTDYDEFVIGSADADFTPLLQRLRARDRRTALVTSGTLAPATRANADVVVDDQRLVGLLAGEVLEPDVGGTEKLEAERLRVLVGEALAEASGPISQSALVSQLRSAIGVDVRVWPGGPSFVEALRALEVPNLVITMNHVYDSTRHSPPESRASSTPLLAPKVSVPPAMERVCKVLDFPRVAQHSWPAVFQSLAEYAARHEFTLSDATRTTRDDLVAQGHEVGRQAVGSVVRGARDGGVDLNEAPSAGAIAVAVMRSITERSAGAGLALTTEDLGVIGDWLGAPVGNDEPWRSAVPAH